jgi:hypothetical protein
MKAVTLERRTRRLVRFWTSVSVATALAATLVALAAGGTSLWVRWVLGLASIYGFAGASRFRSSLHLGVLAGVAMIAVVPHDAVLDRGVVAAVGAVLVLVACEAAHVARRLITIAPVQSTRLDAKALAVLTAAAVAGVAVTGVVAQLDKWSSRPLVLGLAITGGAVIALTQNGSADTG